MSEEAQQPQEEGDRDPDTKHMDEETEGRTVETPEPDPNDESGED